MSNDHRESELRKVQSRRRTLLCCSSLCLVLFLILFLFLTQVFHYRSINIENGTISLNLIKFRSSLIHCGQSIVKEENLYNKIIELNQLMKIHDEISIKEDGYLIIWLEYILKECYQARQYSILEQKNPTIIRKLISFLRKEILYLAGFFIKNN